MKLTRLHLLPLVAIVMLVAACSKTPRGVLSQEKMASLVADVYRGEAVIEFNSGAYYEDSMKKVIKQSVLLAHGVTQEEFDSSMSWYGHNIEQYLQVCDRAVEMLEADMEKIGDDPDGMNLMLVAGDSAQVWPLPTYYHIQPNTPARIITFNLPVDDTWERGDNYTLAFKMINNRSSVKTGIAADYDNGWTEYIRSIENSDGWSETTLRLDSSHNAVNIYGFIEFNPADGEHMYLDSISLYRTRLDPRNYYRRARQVKFKYGRTATTD